MNQRLIGYIPPRIEGLKPWKSIMLVQVPFCHFITVNGCTNFQMGNILPQLQGSDLNYVDS